ncbi:MAG TPA: acyl-CoA dehydrogenase [Porphyromonadaceae bacterium]|nr:acyl-CoA dehydrogenase [Porphyromonadaceae bacterium]
MENFYTDNPALRYYLNNSLMRQIVTLRERDFSQSQSYGYAPLNFEDAMEGYERVLVEIGKVCGEIIAPNAEKVDKEGCHLEENEVHYAEATVENMKALHQAGVSCVSIPRKYNGLNFPLSVFMVMADMISRADASLQNIWGLQDCADTICDFGSEEQKEHYLKRIAQGETMAMALTEPDAGSDLQSVRLKATFDEEHKCWRLNGVKRFITNGNGSIVLVLARTEDGSTDGRGLSMFIYDKQKGGVTIRRIENKMGIKGSPTCEMVFKNAEAELCGERRFGLIKYVMSLMNNARLGIAGQAVGLCEASYREASSYAKERKQFGKSIIEFPPIYEMLGLMKAKVDAVRALLYETCRMTDMYKSFEAIAQERKLTPEERAEYKSYNKIASALTPLCKGISSEYANQCAYDSLQIHGGSGYMKDYTCERVYRDSRITSIYEGTTQLQVIASIPHILNGTYANLIQKYNALNYPEEFIPLRERINTIFQLYLTLVERVKALGNAEAVSFLARKLYEMVGCVIMSYLLLIDASQRKDLFENSLKVFVDYAEVEVKSKALFIENFGVEKMEYYKK